MITDLITAAASVCPTYLPGKTPATQLPPYAILHAGSGVPTDRMLDGRTPWRTSRHRLIAVSTVADGARRLADALTNAIDGPTWQVDFISDPLRNDTDPSDPRWTSTLEILHHT